MMALHVLSPFSFISLVRVDENMQDIGLQFEKTTMLSFTVFFFQLFTIMPRCLLSARWSENYFSTLY